jgi:hypothetical protein
LLQNISGIFNGENTGKGAGAGDLRSHENNIASAIFSSATGELRIMCPALRRHGLSAAVLIGYVYIQVLVMRKCNKNNPARPR